MRRRGNDIKTLILCGGRGVRAYPLTMEKPKSLLDVGGQPVLRHVMEIYARQEFTRFVLATGFRGDLIREWVSTLPDSWEIDVIDTGEDAETGERVLRCDERLTDSFFLTYTDGLANIDLRKSLEFHCSHGAAATVTIVPLPSPYGTIETSAGELVTSFVEKPALRDHWINGGFFVMEKRVFEKWNGRDLEREVLPRLAEGRHLYAYRHEGFWKSMDTHKDAMALAALCEEARLDNGGDPPWLRFETPASS